LERELAAIRTAGYAHSQGEHAAGVYGLAAPVWSDGDRGVAEGIKRYVLS
jgi:DNA-binding IclR family transcriptional regulator